MRTGDSILDRTRKTTGAVVQAMGSVMDYLSPVPGASQDELGCKFDVDTVEELYPELRTQLTQAMRYLRREWNEIIQNDMRMEEASSFVKMCREFQGVVTQFDNCVCEHDAAAAAVLNDWWIGRTYFVMMHDWARQNAYLTDFIENRFRPLVLQKNPFNGAARKFRNYFSGVGDNDLEAFVRYGVPFPKRITWRGERCEAVIMGKLMGRTCAEMNHAFLILGADRMPKVLSYQRDYPKMGEQYYGITPLTQELLKGAHLETGLL